MASFDSPDDVGENGETFARNIQIPEEREDYKEAYYELLAIVDHGMLLFDKTDREIDDILSQSGLDATDTKLLNINTEDGKIEIRNGGGSTVEKNTVESDGVVFQGKYDTVSDAESAQIDEEWNIGDMAWVREEEDIFLATP